MTAAARTSDTSPACQPISGRSSQEVPDEIATLGSSPCATHEAGPSARCYFPASVTATLS